MRIKTGTPSILSPSISRAELRPEEFTFSESDLVYFSPLRWEMLSQRSQQVLGKHTQERRVFFIEEPVAKFIDSWWIDVNQNDWGVWVAVPHVLDWVSDELRAAMGQSLMDELFEQFAIATPTIRYSTPSPSVLPTFSRLKGR